MHLSTRNFLTFICSLFLLFADFLVFFLRFIPERLYPKLLYPIEDEIISTTTRVIFTRSKYNRQPVCLKLSQLYNEQVWNPKLVIRKADNLLEGLEFNRRFAPKVYLGVAPVELSKKQSKILRSKLIEKPNTSSLKSGLEYALVMRRLDSDWRLDSQIRQGGLDTRNGIEFLAKEVAQMHRLLDGSPENKGKPTSIASKLEINRQLFEECLCQLTRGHDFIEKYFWISDLMVRACDRCMGLFQQRYDDKNIKRCHGDLKATNLWIEPEKTYILGLKKISMRMIALDCVDFNPEFCHIDTLSDVAMLIIDLEMHLLRDWLKVNSGSNGQEQEGESLAGYFLDCYLREMEEDREKWNPLLEYYMTEKSMVCAYVSILYDQQPENGKKYLRVASIHAQKLEKILKQSASKEQTPSFVVSSHVR